MNIVTGTVFNIQRYSIDDGPGIRTTVFLKGCPLRCLWCSNPESQHPWPEVIHRNISCIKCGRCMDACPVNAVSIGKEGVQIDRNICTRCQECVKVCPTDTLRVMGKEMSVGEVYEEVERDIEYYRNSGGGVTVSGGEVLSQPEFTAALLKRCRDAGIHTCIDTSGYGPTAALEKILPYTCLVLLDLKHMDPMVHRLLTAQTNELILNNLKIIVDQGTPVIIRVPVIPGFNDSDDQLKSIARTVASLTKGAKVSLLPYHRYGFGKYQMLDLEYRLGELGRPTDERLQQAKEIVESHGLDCEIVV